MKLTWHNTTETDAKSLEQLVATDLARLNVNHPSQIVFHHVFTSKDYSGPLVFVWGESNDDSFHCEYVLESDWKKSSELGIEREPKKKKKKV